MTYGLMVSSLVLLLVLQFFWLHSSYEKAYMDLRKETSSLFRNTLFALRDSIFMKRIEAASSVDSIPRRGGIRIQRRDSAIGVWATGTPKVHTKANSFQIYISTTAAKDSLQDVLNPLVSKLHSGHFNKGNGFVVRFDLDTLNEDSLRVRFQQELAKADIDASFRIDRFLFKRPPLDLDPSLHNIMLRAGEGPPPFEQEADFNIYADTLTSEWVRYDPAHRYAATLTDIRPLLIKQIAPEILFSFFLTALTSLAFVFMYRSIRTQQRLMEMKNDFISNISHELKTPVTTVSVALEALKNFKGLENPRLTEEYLDIAQNELSRLALLTDKVLKSAIFESKGVSFEPEPVDLEKLVHQILNSMRLLFEKQKAKVEFEKIGENFVVSGGSVHLTNVIYNLLDNALKYSPGEPNIKISLKNNQHQIEILVKDQGIGIPTEYRKKIFEKFFRVPTGDVHNIKGYGLGLSYVDSVVRSHKGSIEVAGGNGPGSVFRIVLPK